MKSSRIASDYFSWICEVVKADKKRHSYRNLLEYLDMIEFEYSNDFDSNRADDGMNLRYRFGYDLGYMRNDILDTFGDKPCSVLEMMVALAIRCEETYMHNPDYGDRTDVWFWEMVENFGFMEEYDENFQPMKVSHTLYKFMNRDYNPDGSDGGMFILSNPRKDMREYDLWYQLNFYLAEKMGMVK